MTTTADKMTTSDPFMQVLAATSNSPDIRLEDDLYGFFVGSWELDVVAYPDEGNVTHSTGEAHCARVCSTAARSRMYSSILHGPTALQIRRDLPFS